MPATIHLKTSSWYRVDAFREDIANEWAKALNGEMPLRTYTLLDSGIPHPQITVDLREISHVEESRR